MEGLFCSNWWDVQEASFLNESIGNFRCSMKLTAGYRSCVLKLNENFVFSLMLVSVNN